LTVKRITLISCQGMTTAGPRQVRSFSPLKPGLKIVRPDFRRRILRSTPPRSILPHPYNAELRVNTCSPTVPTGRSLGTPGYYEPKDVFPIR
jgi:hypothetical protein